MATTLSPTRVDGKYLVREAALILLWSYIILVAGTFTGFISFRIQLASFVLSALVIGSWLLLALLRGRRIPASGLEKAIIVFVTTQVIALAFSEDIRRSLPVVSMYVFGILVFYLAVDSLSRGLLAELVERTLLIIGTLVILFAVFELIQNFMYWREITQGLPYFPPFKYRLYSWFGDANLLAAFVNLLIPLIVVRLWRASGIVARLVLGAWLLAALLVLYFADSRGGLLGFFVGFAVVALGWLAEKRPKSVVKLWEWGRGHRLLVGSLGVVVLAVTVWVGFAVLSSARGSSTHAPALASRTVFWSAAWEAFRSSPWIGTGPGTYPTDLMRYSSTPPDRPYLHAHSVPITFLAESGLIGLAGFVVLTIAVARKIWFARSFWSDSWRWLALVAALVGYLAHSLFDNFLYFPSTSIVVVVYVALLIHADGNHETVEQPKALRLAWLLAPAIIAAAFAVYSLRAYAHEDRGVELAIAGDWHGAAAEFDMAVELDPQLALYWFESGFAYGILANQGDEDVLRIAIEQYEHGLAIQPEYALNQANLATLYWHAGQPEQAQESMAEAVRLAPESYEYWLAYGLYLEATGQTELAWAAYLQALNYQPFKDESNRAWISSSVFWAETEIAQAAVSALDVEIAAQPTSAAEFSRQGRRQVQGSEFELAESSFHSAWTLNPLDIDLYLGLAELSIAQDDLLRADQYLRISLWLQSLSNQRKVLPLLTWAELAVLQGDEEAAFSRYQQVYEAVTEYTINGWGSKGWNPYAWFVFRRGGLPLDVLPQFIRIDLTPGLAERLLPLVSMYEERGEFAEAEEVRRALDTALFLP